MEFDFEPLEPVRPGVVLISGERRLKMTPSPWANAEIMRFHFAKFLDGGYLRNDGASEELVKEQKKVLDLDRRFGLAVKFKVTGGVVSALVESVLSKDCSDRAEDMRWLLYASRQMDDDRFEEELDETLKDGEKDQLVRSVLIGLRSYVKSLEGVNITQNEGEVYQLEVNGQPETVFGNSPTNEIFYRGKFVARKVGKVDVVEGEGVTALVCPKKEALVIGGVSEDAIGMRALDDGRVLMTVNDGVSKSFLAEMAARFSAGWIAKNGTGNLFENLSKLAMDIQEYHGLLKVPQDLSLLVKGALRDLLDRIGSQTTCNQFLIDKRTGEVKILIAGDGGWAVFRKNGELETNFLNEGRSPPAGLSTKDGLKGSPKEGRLKLESGDVFYCFSDGISEEMVRDMRDLSETGELMKVMEKRLSDTNNDDQSLVIYRQE